MMPKVEWKRVLRYLLYLFLALIIQTMLLSRTRIAGVCPYVLPAAAVAVGMFEGPVAGVLYGLLLGYFADMAFVENTVLFTLLFPALAFAAGFIAQFFINRRFFAYMGAALLGLAITALGQMLHTSTMDGFSGAMLSTALLQTLWSLPLAAPLYFPPARWID
jgi:cell shape-determining protein MreD